MAMLNNQMVNALNVRAWPLPVLAAPAARLESEVEIKPIAQEWDLQPSAVLNFFTFPFHNFYL